MKDAAGKEAALREEARLLTIHAGTAIDEIARVAFVPRMEIDEDKIDDAVLALLWLTLHYERRAWKGFDWDALARLHE